MKKEETSEGKYPWLEDTDEKIHERQREFRQVHKFGQLMLD